MPAAGANGFGLGSALYKPGATPAQVGKSAAKFRAAANALPDAVPEAIKQQRLARFMEVQKKISSEKLQQRIGRILTVLVDEVRGNQAVARSSADAPDIDGVVYLDTAQGLNPGDLTRVKITDADAHDLWARPA